MFSHNPYQASTPASAIEEPSDLLRARRIVRILVFTTILVTGAINAVQVLQEMTREYQIPFTDTLRPGFSLFALLGGLVASALAISFLAKFRWFPIVYLSFIIANLVFLAYQFSTGFTADFYISVTPIRALLAIYLIFGRLPRKAFGLRQNYA